MSPTTTVSTGTWCISSTRVVMASMALRRSDTSRTGRPLSQARSSRSWRRATLATSAGTSPRWINAEGVKNRVVEMRGNLGTLLGANPLAALGCGVANQPEDPRRQDQGETARRGGDGDHGRLRRAGGLV